MSADPPPATQPSLRGWRGISAAVYAGVAALLVVNVLPALVNVIALGLHWDDSALGLLAAADVAGITVGSLAGIPLVHRFTLKAAVLVGVAALIAADVACAITSNEATMVAFRFVGGVSSGVILAACYALYSYTQPQRNFAMFSLAQMTSGFIGVTVLPLLAARSGWQSAFFFLAAATAIALPLGVWLPAHSHRGTSGPLRYASRAKSNFWLWSAVAGIVFYVIGEGAVWTFMERMGSASGISEHDVNVAVSACTLAGALGAVVTMFPSRRLGAFWPLTLSALLSVASVCVMRSSNPTVFLLALCGFTFAWLAFATIQFAVITTADTQGSATIAMSAAWYAGFTVGPYVAGELVSKHGFAPVQYLGVSGVLLALLLLLPLRQKEAPATT